LAVTPMKLHRPFPSRIALCVASILGYATVLILLVLIDASRLEGETSPWREVDHGLLIGEFEPAQKPGSSDARILVLKIDPQKYSFKLLSASETGGRKMTLKEWSEKHGLVAAFNAGMYQEDGITSVGYMKNFKHVNNGRLNKNKAVLALNPVDAGVPEVQIIDRECQAFESLKGKYRTLVQSIRMVSCEQQNVWSPQATAWSTLAIGMDKSGNVLIIFCHHPYSVHDLIEILLSLPLSLYNAMYLEGGPQASLYLSTKDVTLEKHGGWEGSPESHGPFEVSWPLPNVLGIVRR
jgi:uncharacterized protein YigE (DUF2233 family)